MPFESTPPNAAVVTFMNKVVDVILNPIITFLFAVAVVYFLWGLFVFIKEQDNADAQEEGKRHMFWGVVGVFLMVAVYGILAIIDATAMGVGR